MNESLENSSTSSVIYKPSFNNKIYKTLAIAMLISLPFLGFYLGLNFNKCSEKNTTQKVDTKINKESELNKKIQALLNNSYVDLGSTMEIYNFNINNIYIPAVDGREVQKSTYWAEGRIVTSYKYTDEVSGISYSVWTNVSDGENPYSNMKENFIILDGPEFIGPLYVQDELIKDSEPILITDWFDYYSGYISSPWSITGTRIFALQNAGVSTEFIYIELSKPFEGEFGFRGTTYSEDDLNSAKNKILLSLEEQAKLISRKYPSH